jgi:hypothetical protein
MDSAGNLPVTMKKGWWHGSCSREPFSKCKVLSTVSLKKKKGKEDTIN